MQILQTRELTVEQNDYLSSHTVALDALPAVETVVETAPVVEEEESDMLVKGKTTFAEVLSWGVTQEQIEAVLGLPMPSENLTVIKDFCAGERVGL